MVFNSGTRCGMAHFYRLTFIYLRILLVGFSLFISENSFADNYCASGLSQCQYTDPVSAYKAVNALQPYQTNFSFVSVTSAGADYNFNGTIYKFGTFTFSWLNSTNQQTQTTTKSMYYNGTPVSCPSGQTLDGSGVCQCNTGTHKLPVNNYNSTERCVANSACQAGTPYTGGLTSQAASQGWACKQDDGCQYNVTSSVKDGAGSWSGKMVGMGTYCTVAGDGTNAVSPLAAPESKCLAAGKSFGYVNGAVVCTNPTESKSSATASGVTTAANGSKVSTSTSTTTSVNPDGTITTNKTTTSTPTNADGTSGTPSTTTESETQEKSTFCEENPNSTICKDSEFTGACSSSFACNGDAVQCAIAQDLHKRHCTMFESKTALSDLGTASANGVAITDESPLSSGNRINIDLGGKLDMSRGLSGTCIPTQTIDVMGKSIKLDTTEFCKWADAFGYLVVSISLIGGVKIIGRGM